MSGDAIRAWIRQVTGEMLTQAALTVPEKRRPAPDKLELVGKHLAESLKDGKGYVDETEQQIVAGLHGTVSVSTVGDALDALREIWVPVKRGNKGYGTHRVFVLHDPKQLLKDHTQQRDYPVMETGNNNGKSMPLQRENNAPQRGNPVTPEHNLNTAPPAPAGWGLCSPDDDAQHTPPCRVCADAAGTYDPKLPARLAVAVSAQLQARRQSPLTADMTHRLERHASILLRHYPDRTREQHIETLHLWVPLALRHTLDPHDALLQLAHDTPTKDNP